MKRQQQLGTKGGNPNNTNFFSGELREAIKRAGFKNNAAHLGHESVVNEVLTLKIADVRKQNVVPIGALIGKVIAIFMGVNSRQSGEGIALAMALFAKAHRISTSNSQIYDTPDPGPTAIVNETEETQETAATVISETDESDLDLPKPKRRRKKPPRTESTSVANILATMPLSQEPAGFSLNPDNNAVSSDDEKAPPLFSSPMNTQEFVDTYLPPKP